MEEKSPLIEVKTKLLSCANQKVFFSEIFQQCRALEHIFWVLQNKVTSNKQWNLSDTQRDQGNVSKGPGKCVKVTMEMCQIVQDVGILKFYFSEQKNLWDHNFLSDVIELENQIAQVPLYYHNIT